MLPLASPPSELPTLTASVSWYLAFMPEPQTDSGPAHPALLDVTTVWPLPQMQTTALSLGLILSASSLLGHAFHHPTPHKPRDLPNPFPQELSIYRPLQLKQASPLMAAPVALRNSPVRSACSPAPQIRGVKRWVSILCTPFFPHLERKHLLF